MINKIHQIQIVLSITKLYIRKYKEAINNNKGAILFCVIGGKLSEGINFNDNLARNVTIIGMPYPNPKDPIIIERMKYYNSISIDTNFGKEYYENLCMKAVNQSIGRSIRHINDYSTIILMDSRYSDNKTINKLPNWIKQSFKIPNTFNENISLIKKYIILYYSFFKINH